MQIQINDISKIYGEGENRVVALAHASLTIESGDFISIMGPSGSGKSTLLHIINGLDAPTSGQVLYGNTDIHHGSDRELSAFRRRKIGFVFQQFNRLPVLTAQENIAMPLLLDRQQPDDAYLHTITHYLGIDERLCDVGDTLCIGSVPLPNSSLSLLLREYDEAALSLYPSLSNIKEGRLPERAGEIALPQDALGYLGLNPSVGDVITLDLSAGDMAGLIAPFDYSADFTLSGILENDYLGYSTGMVNGIVGSRSAEELLPPAYRLWSVDFKTKEKAGFQNVIDELAGALGLDERYIQYNWVVLDALGIPYAGESQNTALNGFPFMALSCILAGALVLLAAGLVIYNILKISVTKRIGSYGTLRALGAERGQIYRLVSLQLLILCGIGIPIGLLLGSLGAKGVLTAATGTLNPGLFMVNNAKELHDAIRFAGTGGPLPLLLPVAVTLLFAMTAALPAARYASRVSPTVAMSGQTTKIKRRVKKQRHIHSFAAYCARLNLKRSRGRTAITVLSLVMSITVFVALQGFTSLLDTSEDVRALHTGDYAVTNETAGISAADVETLRGHDAVKTLATTKLTVFMPEDKQPFETDITVQSHETLQIASLDEEHLCTLVADINETDRADLTAGNACIIKNPIPISFEGEDIPCTSFSAGDTIELQGRTLRVAGLAGNPVAVNNSGFINGVQVIVTDDVYNAVVGDDRYTEVYPTLEQNADTDAFETWLDDFCAQEAGTHWLSYRMTDAQTAESFAQTKLLCWALIAFVGIIGVLNIINTVYSSIHTRVAEIGMQRAIGMSTAGLYKTFLWEGAYYGIYASVIGAVSGYVCTIFINAARQDVLTLVPVPVCSIAEAALVSLAACLLATAIPLRTIAYMRIVEAIEAVE